MSVTHEIAKNIINLAGTDLPQEAIEKAPLAILDTLGVTLAGSRHEGAAILSRIVLPTAAPGPALVFGTRIRLNVLDAAHLNGTYSHMLDFDDSNLQLRGHPSVSVLPALLAVAEELGASGHEVIRAYIIGFETATRIGMGVNPYQYAKGWHPTSTVGVFGGVAAYSILYRMTEDQITMALGIAASMASGLQSNFGSMTKPLGVGQAARNALLAVLLARSGFTATDLAFDHPRGYLNVFNDGPGNYDVARILSGWGQPFSILDPGFKQKRFPCCYACLGPIDGIEELARLHRLTPADIDQIHVVVHPYRFPHINVPDPRSPLQAKFSVHYCVSRMLMNGTLTFADFEGTCFEDPATRRLMERVTFASRESNNADAAEVRVTTTAGNVFEAKIESALGATYKHPLPIEALAGKFRDCASRLLPTPAVEALYDGLRGLDAVPDIRTLTTLVAQVSD